MKILIYTDPHIDAHQGNKHFLDLASFYFKEEILKRCQDENITTCICAGDFFNSRQSVSLKALDYVHNEFIPSFEAAGITTYMIAGNHDVAYKNTNTVNSLSVFKRSPWFKVIDHNVSCETIGGKRFVLVPWINAENYQSVMEDISRYRDDNTIMIGHFEIAGMKMYQNSSLCEHGLSADELSGYEAVWSGHFHHHSVSGNIDYLGSLFHLSWSCAGDWRGYRIFDTETGECEYVENEYSLYTVIEWDEYCAMKNSDELRQHCSGQYVKLVITDSDVDRIAVDTAKRDIELLCPIRLDVVDATMFIPNMSQNDQSASVGLETISQTPLEMFNANYVQDADVDDREHLLELFSEYAAMAETRLRDYGDL